MAMSFGIHIGHLGGPLGEMRRLWRFADSRGFDWFSVADHFQESPPRGGDVDCFESVSTLACIDHIAGGRLECAIGAGWHEPEHRAFGIPFDPIGVRMDRLEEYVQVLRLLFDQRVSSFSGKHYILKEARCNPKPLQDHLRIWIGGAGEKRTLRTVARYADGWNATYLSPDSWRQKSAVLDRWCESERRDPRSIRRSANVGFYMGADQAGAKRQAQRYIEHWGRESNPGGGFLLGMPAQVSETVQAYREAGVERLNIVVREGPYDWEALDSFAELAGLSPVPHA
jgi:alkanesulfonate monooxygenase SsuD/methylene tetrahydromethanopterin reductase-like flavin-dependent oxidoreductase (luciferase family)